MSERYSDVFSNCWSQVCVYLYLFPILVWVVSRFPQKFEDNFTNCQFLNRTMPRLWPIFLSSFVDLNVWEYICQIWIHENYENKPKQSSKSGLMISAAESLDLEWVSQKLLEEHAWGLGYGSAITTDYCFPKEIEIVLAVFEIMFCACSFSNGVQNIPKYAKIRDFGGSGFLGSDSTTPNPFQSDQCDRNQSPNLAGIYSQSTW